jgi:hypothetical protein
MSWWSDLKTERAVTVLPTGKVPHAMAIAPGGKIFVNNRGSKELPVCHRAASRHDLGEEERNL